MSDKKDDEGSCPGRDVMHVGPALGDGYHPYVRHRSGCTMEAGLIRTSGGTGNDEAAACDGLVRLTGTGPTFDVETVYERGQGQPTNGPAMVSNDAFRSGWDRIFGTKATVGQA